MCRSTRARKIAALPLFLLALAMARPATAHVEAGVPGGLLSGFSHPLNGPDHLVAMIAVGLWGAQLGPPALWTLPICFPAVMAVGGVFGVLHVPFGHVEFLIALSALLLGLVVALQARAPVWAATALVGVFAVFHGYAHGREMPGAADALAYGVGFVVATGALHAAGILLGALARWPAGSVAVRTLGAAIAGVGALLLASLTE